MRRRWVLDCETTSLAVDYKTGSGVIWELAILDPDTGEQHMWRMLPKVGLADPKALEAGKFYERTRLMRERDRRANDLAGRVLSRAQPWSGPEAVAAVLAPLLDGATVICAVPTFDKPFVEGFLNAYHQALTCHFRWRDIGSMAWGYLCGIGSEIAIPDPDASTDDFAMALRVNPDGFTRHSALGDVGLCAAMLAVIEARRPQVPDEAAA